MMKLYPWSKFFPLLPVLVAARESACCNEGSCWKICLWMLCCLKFSYIMETSVYIHTLTFIILLRVANVKLAPVFARWKDVPLWAERGKLLLRVSHWLQMKYTKHCKIQYKKVIWSTKLQREGTCTWAMYQNYWKGSRNYYVRIATDDENRKGNYPRVTM